MVEQYKFHVIWFQHIDNGIKFQFTRFPKLGFIPKLRYIYLLLWYLNCILWLVLLVEYNFSLFFMWHWRIHDLCFSLCLKCLNLITHDTQTVKIDWLNIDCSNLFTLMSSRFLTTFIFSSLLWIFQFMNSWIET